jgi:hypothetical protein
MAVVRNGEGSQICVATNDTNSLDVVVDLMAGFAAKSGVEVKDTNVRILDTRDSGGPFSGEKCIDIPGYSGYNAAIINVVSVNSQANGFISLYPGGTTRPETSSINYETGIVKAGNAITKIGLNGQICIYAHSATDAVVDVQALIKTASSPQSVPIVEDNPVIMTSPTTTTNTNTTTTGNTNSTTDTTNPTTNTNTTTTGNTNSTTDTTNPTTNTNTTTTGKAGLSVPKTPDTGAGTVIVIGSVVTLVSLAFVGFEFWQKKKGRI